MITAAELSFDDFEKIKCIYFNFLRFSMQLNTRGLEQYTIIEIYFGECFLTFYMMKFISNF